MQIANYFRNVIKLQLITITILITPTLMHLQENSLFDIWVKVIQNFAQFPLHHVAYPGTKFEVATSNGLGNLTARCTDGRTDRQTRDQL